MQHTSKELSVKFDKEIFFQAQRPLHSSQRKLQHTFLLFFKADGDERNP